jgi:MFS transporter, FSR family, fosmidomycin resistance protein
MNRMEAHVARSGWLTILQNRPLLTLMLGHFTVDCYAGVIPILYPLLIARFQLDLAGVGLVSLAYIGTASLSQPLFGWLADRYGTRLIGLALIWTALSFAVVGFAPTFPILLLLAALAGLGSGVYHPFGALSARDVIPDAQRNTAMSIYVTGGTLGVALGPLVGIVLFDSFGLAGTALMALPGLLVAPWLLWELRGFELRGARPGGSAVSPSPTRWGPLAATIGTMMAYTWVLYSTEAFVPTWYAAMGYSASFYGPLATTLLLASAVGAIGAGALADRFGRRAVAVASLALTVPCILLFTQFSGPVAFLTATLLGLASAAVGPLMLVTAQQLLSGRAGVASGLVLGIGFISGAIGVPITGAIADAIGIPGALNTLALLAAATIPLALLLPSEAALRAIRK